MEHAAIGANENADDVFGGAPAVATFSMTRQFAIADDVVNRASIAFFVPVGYDLPHVVHEISVAPLNLAKYDVADLDIEAVYGIYEACVAVKDERFEGAAAAHVLDRVAFGDCTVHDCVPLVGQISPHFIVLHICPVVCKFRWAFAFATDYKMIGPSEVLKLSSGLSGLLLFCPNTRAVGWIVSGKCACGPDRLASIGSGDTWGCISRGPGGCISRF